MYIVTYKEYFKAVKDWIEGGQVFHNLDSAKEFMGFVLKMGGDNYRNVELWNACKMEYGVEIVIDE